MSKKILYQCDFCNKTFENKSTAEQLTIEKFEITIGDKIYSDICLNCKNEIKLTLKKLTFQKNKSVLISIFKGITK